MFARFSEERANGTCAICDQPALTGLSSDRKCSEFICGRCGAYRLSEEFIWEIPESQNPLFEQRYKISWAFRVASEGIEDIRDLPIHEGSDVSSLLATAEPSVEDKLGSLLHWMGRNSKSPGKFGIFDYEHDFTLICARDEEEASFLSESLSDRGWITLQDPTFSSTTHTYRLTTDGWAEINRRNQSGVDSNTAFIAMSFAPSRQPIERVISTALAAAGYTPVRMDRIEHANRIDDEIISQLRRAKFLVADLTEQNNGVYFESGFMLGLGRPVLWLCDKEDLGNVHFDMRQYNTIDYDGPEDLQKRLQYRIEAILGRGIN